MIAIIKDPNIGDSLCAMWAVQILASECKLRDQTLYLQTANRETELLMLPDGVHFISELHGSSRMQVAVLSIGPTFTTPRGRYNHPVIHYLDQIGIRGYQHVEQLPTPKIHFLSDLPGDEPLPIYDFLIAPFSLDYSRMWYVEHYEALFDALREDFPGCRIGIIGGLNDPRPWDDVEYVYGVYLSNLIRMMRRTRRAVITIDSGPSRLAHVAGITNHVILAPKHLPEVWVTHPGATCVSQPWNVDSIMEAVCHTSPILTH